MYKIGDKLKYKGMGESFTAGKIYEIATQRVSDKQFIIFDDNNLSSEFTPIMLDYHFTIEDKSLNNGGSTDYYKFKENWKECQDIIEDRELNFSQGNIFKSAFCFNVGRHSATDYVRELNKIIYFANRELERVKNERIN